MEETTVEDESVVEGEIEPTNGAEEEGGEEETQNQPDETATDDNSSNMNDNTNRVPSDRNLFVDNLPSTMTAAKFLELFQPFAVTGRLCDAKFLKHTTGSETGYGFVEFEEEKDGRSAMNALNGTQIGEHNIRVSRAKAPRHELSQTNIYIEGIPNEWKDHDLRKKFEEFGTVKQARVIVNRQKESRGVGFVHYATESEAQLAIKSVNGTPATENDEGPLLRVKLAKVAKPKRRGFGRGFRGRGGPFGGPFGGGWGGGWGGGPGWGSPQWGPGYGGRRGGFGGRGRGGFGGRGGRGRWSPYGPPSWGGGGGWGNGGGGGWGWS